MLSYLDEKIYFKRSIAALERIENGKMRKRREIPHEESKKSSQVGKAAGCNIQNRR